MSRNGGYRTFPTSVRRETLKRDDFQCQVYGHLGPERGGNIDLEAYHMREGPEYVYRDHTDNDTMMCIPCHHLTTHRTTTDDLLFALDGVAAEVNLLYKDVEILVYPYEYSPVTTSEIHEATSGSTWTSIIERLWASTSVDRDVGSPGGSFIDKDPGTDERGYPDDIGRTVCGRVLEGEKGLVSQLRDELLRRFFNTDVNRSTLTLFFDHSQRATSYIVKQAGAIRIPLNDEPHPDALMSEDESDQVIDGTERLFGGNDRSR